jgi:TPR repeat protein
MALYLNSGYSKAYLGRGDLYLITGRPDLAAGDYQKACDLGSEDACVTLRSMNSWQSAR